MTCVIDVAGARRAGRRAVSPRLHGRGPDSCATGRSSTTSSTPRRSAGRLDRRAGRRHLPTRAPRRRRALRLQRRPELAGSASSSRRGCALAGDATDGATSRSTRSRPSAPLRVHRRPRLRPARDRDPGPGASSAAVRRPRLRGPARGRVLRRSQLRPAWRHVLLRLDGHRPDRRESGFDLALTELLDAADHRFLVEVGQRPRRRGARGAAAPRADAADRGGRGGGRAHAAATQGRTLDTDRIRDLLYAQPRAPALGRGRRPLPDLWELHAGLPDLLLHHVEDATDLAGDEAVRVRRWDSCFSLDYSYIHGGSVRASAQAATGSG